MDKFIILFLCIVALKIGRSNQCCLVCNVMDIVIREHCNGKCCGNGDCNMFCCNCDDGCNPL